MFIILHTSRSLETVILELMNWMIYSCNCNHALSNVTSASPFAHRKDPSPPKVLPHD